MQSLDDFTGQARQLLGVGAKDLDRQVASHARQHLRGAHFNGLGEAQVHARNRLASLPDGVDEFFLGLEAPLLAGLQHQKAVCFVEPHGVEAEFIGTDPRNDVLDLRNRFQDAPLQCQIGGHRLRQVNGGELFHLHDDVAFVQRRHERFADQRKQRQRACKCQDRGHHHHAGVAQRGIEQRGIARFELAHQPGCGMVTRSQGHRCQHRDHGERQQ